MKKLLYTLFFNLICIFSLAQSSTITGRIVIDDAVSGQNNLNGILVINTRTNASTTTNEEGMFSINASVGDQLSFSHDFYKERTLKITKAILEKGFIVVHLNMEVVELKETNINRLDKYWANNIKNKKSDETTLYENLGLDPSLKDKKVNPNANSILNGNGFLDPMQWVSIISGEKKKQKKQNQYFNNVTRIKDLENYFTTNYFIESLAIPKERVTEFITLCYYKYGLDNFIKRNEYERIEEVFLSQAPLYLKKINDK